MILSTTSCLILRRGFLLGWPMEEFWKPVWKQKLHTSGLNVLITLLAFYSFMAMFADTLYVFLYCIIHEFHLHYKALPFSLLVSFICFSPWYVIPCAKFILQLLWCKKRKKMYAKKQAFLATNKGLSSAKDGHWCTLQSNWSWEISFSLFANYCPLLKTVDFLEGIFCLFPYSLLTEQHIVLFDVCAWWAGKLERI